MCLAVPLKIISIDGKTAVGEASGLTQKLRVDFIPGLKASGGRATPGGCWNGSGSCAPKQAPCG